MSGTIRAIVRELFGLFVDDGSFAVTVVAWLAMVWLVLPRMHLPLPGGVLLFLGLALILVESAIRFSRKKR